MNKSNRYHRDNRHTVGGKKQSTSKVSLSESDRLLKDLQTDWERLNHRVAKRTAHGKGRLLHASPELIRTLRHHRLKTTFYWIMTVCCLLMTLQWTFSMHIYTTCPQVTTAALVLETVFILVTGYSFAAAIKTTKWQQPVLLNNYIPQMLTIAIAMLLVFPTVSFGQLGDGLVISQYGRSALNHTARLDAIHTVNNVLNEI